MMLGKIKYGKIAIVIFLTILIWVWVDLALDEEFTAPKATINVAFSPNLWVSFDNEPSASIDNIVLKGPASKIAEVRRKLNDGSLALDFFLDPEREGMTTAGPHTLTVLDFVKRSDKMKMKELSGLTVEDCEPEIIDVNVVELVEKSLDIECFDESGAPLEVKSIDPPEVDMYVPVDSRLKAQVKLTRTEIGQARSSVAVKTPFVVLAGQTRQAPKPVQIKMSPEADLLSEYTIERAKLVIAMSVNLLTKYDVEFNHNEVVSPFPILASLEAKQAYESQPVQMTLYILDEDANKEPEEVIPRKVFCNFPEEFVRRDEIRLKNPQKPAEAKFKLIRLTSVPTPPSGPD